MSGSSSPRPSRFYVTSSRKGRDDANVPRRLIASPPRGHRPLDSVIGLRATEVITRDEVTIIVPNSELVGSQVVNHSKPTHKLRVQIPIGVHYRSDPLEVRRVLSEVLSASAHVLKEPAAEVRLDGFGESSLDFSVLIWIPDPREDLRISSAMRFEIHAALKAASIEIPYPQRDLHLRSGFDRLSQ
jgi:potassium-dependent mechanosensitive channel